MTQLAPRRRVGAWCSQPAAVLGCNNLLVQNSIPVTPWADHSAIHRSGSLAQRTLRYLLSCHVATVTLCVNAVLSRTAHIVITETPVLNAYYAAVCTTTGFFTFFGRLLLFCNLLDMGEAYPGNPNPTVQFCTSRPKKSEMSVRLLSQSAMAVLH